MAIVLFVAVIVLVVVFILILKQKQQGGLRKHKEEFLRTAHKMSETLVPDVCGYETLVVQLTEQTNGKDELKKVGAYAAKKLLVRAVSGNTLDYRETRSVFTNEDIYIVRYGNEKVYFFNIGKKLDRLHMEVKEEQILCFEPGNLSEIKIGLGNVTLRLQDGESFKFDFTKGPYESKLEFSNEYQHFKQYLKQLNQSIS